MSILLQHVNLNPLLRVLDTNNKEIARYIMASLFYTFNLSNQKRQVQANASDD